MWRQGGHPGPTCISSPLSRRSIPVPPRPRRQPPSRPDRPTRKPARPAAATRPQRAAGKAPDDDGRERLQKVLAAAGIGSRRACEELITAGRVEVDREVASTLGVRVDPLKQQIRVDGEPLPNPKRVVYLVNKPVGVVCTNYDPTGRPRVIDLVPPDRRLFPVGRLDRTSEGLILVTNDGELANLLTHPRYGVEKRYLVQVAGVPNTETLDQLRQGIALSEATVHAKRVTIRSQHKQSTVLEMVLDEGRNREIRRMLAALGHKVQQLKRVAVGDLSLGNLLPGQWRRLSWEDIEKLRREASAAGANERSRPFPKSRRMAHRGGRQAGPRGTAAGRPPAQGRQPTKPRKRPGKASTWRKAGRRGSSG